MTSAATAIGATLVTAGVMWAVMTPPAQDPARPLRFEIIPPPSQPLASSSPDRIVAISPDGRFIVYRAGAPPQLFVRPIDTRDSRPLQGTLNARAPFLSPDGLWVGSMNLMPGDFGQAHYAVSRQGTLVHIEAESLDTPTTLAWVDRTGRETPIQAPPHRYASARLSPDDDRVAVQINDQQFDIHVYRGGRRRQLD